MSYLSGAVSYGSTGNKVISLPLSGGTPYAVRASMGARVNTTETNIRYSEGFTDSNYTTSKSMVNSFTKNWPYTSEPNYLLAHHSSSGNKVFSCTFVSWDVDELVINVDDPDSNYQLFLEIWYE